MCIRDRYGTLDEMEGQIKFANTWDYDGLVYGVPSTGNAQGVVYNKRVFTEAGVAETPKTPDEFIAALQAIKDYDSSIIPLYTNYADGWPMEQWLSLIHISLMHKSITQDGLIKMSSCD